MTFGAMGDRFNEVAAAIPLRAASGLGDYRLVIEIKKFLEPDKTANAEYHGEIMRRGLAGNRRQRSQERHQVPDVLDRHLGVAGIRKGRIIMLSRRRYATQQRVGEVGRSPGPDPVGFIHGYVWHPKGAVGRRQSQ